MEVDEEIRIAQLMQGSEQAYKYIYDHYYVSLCHLANGYVKDAVQAEMIVGDVIFHLWEIRESLQIKTTMLGYLITAVRNRCLNYLSLARVKREIPVSHLTNEWAEQNDQYATSDDFTLLTMYEKELSRELDEALSSLSIECKTVFLKSRIEKKKYDEISAELGISVNTVKYHIKSALRLLKERLSRYPAVFIIFVHFFRN